MSFNPILTRVLVLSPNPLLGETICNALRQRGPFTAEASGVDPDAGLQAFRPNLIVVDPGHLPKDPGAWLAQVTERLPGCHVVAYIDVRDDAVALRCLAAGFAGVVSQGQAVDTLVEALTVARLGGVYVDQCYSTSGMLSGDARASRGAGPEARLSARERHVLEQVARGFSSKEIAAPLGLSPKTVETHRSRAAAKLGLRRKADIVQHALRNDWFDDRPYAL